MGLNDNEIFHCQTNLAMLHMHMDSFHSLSLAYSLQAVAQEGVACTNIPFLYSKLMCVHLVHVKSVMRRDITGHHAHVMHHP